MACHYLCIYDWAMMIFFFFEPFFQNMKIYSTQIFVIVHIDIIKLLINMLFIHLIKYVLQFHLHI